MKKKRILNVYFIFLLALFTPMCSGIIDERHNNRAQLKTENHNECHVIRKIMIIHCKRGPESCKECKAIEEKKYALLDICLEGEAARRVINIGTDEDPVYVEFEAVMIFETIEEAKEYADEHAVENVKWEE